MEHITCFICQSTQVVLLLRPRRGGAIYRCAVCTNAFTYPAPQAVYDQDTFFLGAKHEEALFRSYAKPIVSFFSQYKQKGNLLDIGAGGGFLLKEAQEKGFTVQGIEPSRAAVRFCRSQGLTVKHGYFKKGVFTKNSFDVIVLSHVLEHVADPHTFLSDARDILRPGGILCLSQTNYTGTIPTILGAYWEGWVPSQHYVHFSPTGVEHLLNMNGLAVEALQILPLGYRPLWKWGSLSTIANNIYNTTNWLISTLRIGLPFVGDQMYVVAHRSQ